MCIEQRGKCYTAGITPTPSPQSGGGISNDLLKFNTPRLSRLDFLHAPPPTSIMSSTLRPSAPLLARASTQIPTIKTTSLAGLQSTLFNICTIINDPIATVHNLNAVDCANWKVSKHCLFVFGVHWSVYLAYYLLPHENPPKKTWKAKQEGSSTSPRGRFTRKASGEFKRVLFQKCKAGWQALRRNTSMFSLSHDGNMNCRVWNTSLKSTKRTWGAGNFALQLNKFLYATAKLNLIWFPRQPEKLI